MAVLEGGHMAQHQLLRDWQHILIFLNAIQSREVSHLCIARWRRVWGRLAMVMSSRSAICRLR